MNTIALFVIGMPMLQAGIVALTVGLSGYLQSREFNTRLAYCVRLSRIEAVSHDPDSSRARELALSEAILALKEASRLRAMGLDSSRVEAHIMEVI